MLGMDSIGHRVAKWPVLVSAILLLVGWLLVVRASVWSEPGPPVGVEDPGLAQLRLVQDKVQAVVKQVMPAVVAVVVGQGQGSGVVVTRDGYVLTAGHVSGKPGQEVTVIFADGKRVKGKTLGRNPLADSGMIKLEGEGPYPYAEMGDTRHVRVGDWVMAIGHPGGFRPGRTPVVRLGRVLLVDPETMVLTDCTLVGGDSGGPLFDLKGKVIGIHSRIGELLEQNIHVPIDTYRETWEALAKGVEVGLAYLGVRGDEEGEQAKILEVAPNSPAAKAGLQPNDVIVSCDGRKVSDYRSFLHILRRKQPGEEMRLEVLRNGEKVELKVKLGKRPMSQP
ncbi:Putative serine protease HtrA [bacterium HR36]|nr:Putative serine protease HtrA [bacterium HR36]